MRKNIKGVQFERWNHAHGCRKWFNMVRDTSSDEIKLIYKMGEKPPSE
jgi:heterotetrameric sarcosine oxidase delta subunit